MNQGHCVLKHEMVSESYLREVIQRKPILVTGSHRSGTTWVGKMLSAIPDVGYIHEPFNLTHRPGICSASFPHWFMYVNQENEAAYLLPLKRTLEFRFGLGAEFPAIQSPRHLGRLFINYKNFAMCRLRHAIPLMKDPIALFSSEWLAHTFGMRVIVLIRHPAAFTSSLKRLNWTHNFSHFLNQPALMRDYLHPFEAEIRAFAQTEHDILQQATLLWKIIYATVLRFQEKQQDWIFMRHEDISADPFSHFEYLYKSMNLTLTDKARRVIEEYSSPDNPIEAIRGHAFGKRNSKANIKSWKKQFSKRELVTLRTRVEEIAHKFYSDADW